MRTATAALILFAATAFAAETPDLQMQGRRISKSLLPWGEGADGREC